MVTDHLILDKNNQNVVIQNSEHGVQSSEHTQISTILRNFNWDDLSLFEVVAAKGSFRKAALALKVSVNTVRTRIERLEETLGTVLFMRTREGVRLNADGNAALEVAKEMQSTSQRLLPRRKLHSTRSKENLRICSSEGIGDFWLTPRLEFLQSLIPAVNVSLVSQVDQHRIHTRESDICLGFSRPSRADAIVCKLATVHMLLYASPAYIEKHGQPGCIDDAENHRFVIQDAPGLRSDTLALLVGDQVARRLTVTKVNTSSSLHRAIANGVGIGALPTYVWAISPSFRPLDLPLQMKFDVWMSYDRSVCAWQPVRSAIDWLQCCFDSKTYPWFKEHFIHPDNFHGQLKSPARK